jgi:hypothetical protein
LDSPVSDRTLSVEGLLRYWGEHGAVEALRRRRVAPARREILERLLDRAGWAWIGAVSRAIDRCVVIEEDGA